MQSPIDIDGVSIAPGERATINLPVARLPDHSEINLPVHVVHGKREGPCLFVSAALHGDEIVGVEIIRRLLRRKGLGKLRGTLLAVPVVNVYGFLHQSRYLPDRRDLNRSFPGSASGSLASRLAHKFLSEVVERATHGIDLHTGSNHRTNLPQIRAVLDEPETAELARTFGAPVVLNSELREGSLRAECVKRDLPMLLYEAGEALRFDEPAVRIGQRGISAVMRAIGMLPKRRSGKAKREPLVASASTWVRAPISGVLYRPIETGSVVEKGQVLGVISDPFGDEATNVPSPVGGVVIGRLNLPLVYQGDALFHVAVLDKDMPADLLLDQLAPEDWSSV